MWWPGIPAARSYPEVGALAPEEQGIDISLLRMAAEEPPATESIQIQQLPGNL